MASKDLDKLMGKLKKNKKPSEKKKKKEDPKDDEFEDVDDEEDQEEEEDQEDQDTEDEVTDDDNPDEVVNQEVALLQNDGIFRRELLVVLKDLVNVQKVTAKTLLDIKKKLDE